MGTNGNEGVTADAKTVTVVVIKLIHSEFQDGNGNGTFWGNKFSRVTRLPVIILTRTVRPSPAEKASCGETALHEIQPRRIQPPPFSVYCKRGFWKGFFARISAEATS